MLGGPDFHAERTFPLNPGIMLVDRFPVFFHACLRLLSNIWDRFMFKDFAASMSSASTLRLTAFRLRLETLSILFIMRTPYAHALCAYMRISV
jgi:hypothetical protein